MYSARHAGLVVRLEDATARTTVSVIPSAGNRACGMTINGGNILLFPYESAEDFKRRGGGLNGIPFLAPWANRLDEQAFYVNGRRHAFDMELGNVRGEIPIHGFLASASEWQVVEVKADADAAWVTSRLEFYRHPEWMRQFPFAHTIDMTYRLAMGVLQVTTALGNLGTEPMPVAIGFHPFFRLDDSPRDDWTISVAARTAWRLAPTKLPTGETEPIEKRFPHPEAVPLKDHDLDHLFSDLVRDDAGIAVMSLRGKRQQVDVLIGPQFRVVLVYAPRDAAAATGGFVCFEPMAGITNALNLAEKGMYNELQSIPPGGVWQESFWVRPSGF